MDQVKRIFWSRGWTIWTFQQFSIQNVEEDEKQSAERKKFIFLASKKSEVFPNDCDLLSENWLPALHAAHTVEINSSSFNLTALNRSEIKWSNCVLKSLLYYSWLWLQSFDMLCFNLCLIVWNIILKLLSAFVFLNDFKQ